MYPWLTRSPTLQVSAIGSTADWHSEALQNEQFGAASMVNFYVGGAHKSAVRAFSRQPVSCCNPPAWRSAVHPV
jgi:hypothetical protein